MHSFYYLKNIYLYAQYSFVQRLNTCLVLKCAHLYLVFVFKYYYLDLHCLLNMFSREFDLIR